MNNFWALTQFEYKKIFRKRSTVIVLVAAFLLSVFSCMAILIGSFYVNGEPVESKVEAMKTDRSYSRALAGRAIDSTLLLEAADAYAKIKVPIDGKYSGTAEYNLYARPYSAIYSIAANSYYSDGNNFGVADFQALTREQAEILYESRTEKLESNINSMAASDTAKQKLLDLNSRIETPFIYDYTEGYERFFGIMYTTGMIIGFTAAILLAPIFSGEYSSGADQLVLSTRHGKKKLIFAKLFAGITIAGGLSLLLSLVTFLQCMLTYGFDGGDAALQILQPLWVYPVTMWQAALLYSVCIILGTVFIGAITILLSSRMKTSFGVIIPICILIVVPVFIRDPETNVVFSNLLSLLPVNMMAVENAFSPHLFELGDIVIKPYIAMPLFAGALTMALLPFAYQGFKNHQIS